MAVAIKAADLQPGDFVRLKKAHPCGGRLWRVNRIGADVGLRCQTCEHYTMIPRFRIERRIREVIRPDADADAASLSNAVNASANAEQPAP